MTVESAVMLFAGFFVVLSLILAILFNPLWLLLAGGVGLVLFQSGFTGCCPIAIAFKKMGLKSGKDSSEG